MPDKRHASQREPSMRTIERAAAKRRDQYTARMAQASSVRRRLWVLRDWLASEVLHAKPEDQERLLAELQGFTERLNHSHCEAPS